MADYESYRLGRSDEAHQWASMNLWKLLRSWWSMRRLGFYRLDGGTDG